MKTSKQSTGINFQLPEMVMVGQANDAALHSPNQVGEPSNATDENSSRTGLPKNAGGMRARMMQLFDTKAVPHEPAERFEGEWESSVAQQICQHWVDSQTAHNMLTVSVVALSEMMALNYERKNRDSIPADQRLLQEANLTDHDYYKAQIRAFLEAVGAKGSDADAVLESFKLAGTGGLHRQHVTAAAVVSNTLGAAAQFVPDMTAKAAIFAVRMMIQGVIAERTVNAGWRRLRNAGTEDMLPLGRADAAPGAKHAPNIFQASSAVISDLKGVEKNLRKMEAAKAALDEACTAHATCDSLENKIALKGAKQNLEMAFAKVCYQATVKTDYNTASESTKIEWRGNERYLKSSYTGTGVTMGAGLFSILTPILGVVAAPATGGISAGAAFFVLAVYLGYQLSSGPSKDGEAKAKRAIVALSKSLDVLSGDHVASQKKRADAYKTYIEEKKAARFALPDAKARAKENAKAKLLTQLEKITQEDKVENLMSPRQNWEAYCAHKAKISSIKAADKVTLLRLITNAAETGMSQDLVNDQIKPLEDQFQITPQADFSAKNIPGDIANDIPDAIADGWREYLIKGIEDQFQTEHQADFSAKNIADAWKVPMRMRMDTASRLLKGKVAKSHTHLTNLTQHPSLKTRPGLKTSMNKQAIEGIRTELRKNLRDMFNLELALRHMKLSVNGNDSNPEAMARATAAIGAIEDEDLRSLFCGDAREQVDAANLAKVLTFGEAERYVYTNIGASAIGIGLNVAVNGVDLGLNAAKAADAVHVGLYDANPEEKPRIPEYSDYKLAALSQAGAPLAAHMNTGDRAAFQKTRMSGISAITKSKGDAVVKLLMDLTGSRTHLGKDDDEVTANLDALIARFWNANSVPDYITLSMARHAPAVDSLLSPPDNTEPENITVDLRTTSAYHRAKYENAPVKEKGKVIEKQAASIGIHALMSLLGLPTQAIAQYSLRNSRRPLNLAAQHNPSVRNALSNAELMLESAAKEALPQTPPPRNQRTSPPPIRTPLPQTPPGGGEVMPPIEPGKPPKIRAGQEMLGRRTEGIAAVYR